MKRCPNCDNSIPDEAHFCPRCLYQYPKEDVVIRSGEKQKKRIYPFVLLGVGLCLTMLIGGILIKRNIADKGNFDDKVSQEKVDQYYRRGIEIPYVERIRYDYRDALGAYEDVKDVFGEETDSTYWEGQFTVHTYGNTEVSVNDEGNVQKIFVNYSLAGNEQHSGIYGIDNLSVRSGDIGSLGQPDKEYGDNEWHYYFEENNYATLVIWFDDNDRVSSMKYYRVYDDAQADKKADGETYHDTIDQSAKNPVDIPHNERITYDLRNDLVSYSEVKREFGKLEDTLVIENGMIVYDHGDVTAYVDEEGQIQEIYIHYQGGKNLLGCGIYGIDNETTKEDVKNVFGDTHRQNGADEWVYYIDEIDVLTLEIFFGSDDLVEEIRFYR